MRTLCWTFAALVAFLLGGSVRADAPFTNPEEPILLDPDFDPFATVIRGQSVEDEPLVTDRPDFTEASSTVGRGVVQSESGYTFTYNDSELDDSLTKEDIFDILLRVGITEDVELRFVWIYAGQHINSGPDAGAFDGAADLGLGTKINVSTQDALIPESAVILQSTVPTGAFVFSSREYEVGVNYLYSWELPCGWSLAGSTGVDTATDTGDNYEIYHQSVALGIPIADGIGMYGEYFGLYTLNRDVDFPENFFNGGFTVLLNNDVQWDIRAGTGLNQAALDLFGGTGLSVRY